MTQIRNILFILLILISGCQTDNNFNESLIVKLSDSDRFKNTIIESQYLNINASEDNVVESKKGNILIIPKGSFFNSKGKIVDDSIQIEFAEASEIDEIILSNLVIQDSAKIYESYLSFFLNATRNGEQLNVNPENPIYFELAADKQLNLYKGTRDNLGKMNWDSLINPVDYLLPVPFELLDFYPPEFEIEVEKGLPFKNYQIKSSELLDSLYYSFATELYETGYYNWSSRIAMINLITPIYNLLMQEEATIEQDETDSISISFCGINPASIKAIRTKRFQNTLISTREFETRLKSIFATCDNEILELYVNNLNKNLWEIDELAAEKLGSSHDQYSNFIKFASYKQTTVKLSDKKAALLSKHYQKSKAKIERELLKLKKEFLVNEKKQLEIAQKKQEEYRELLQERHEYRMNKFGFELTKLGWYNAAKELKLEEVETFDLNVSIDNGKQYDRVYSYVINPRINSIFSLLSSDKVKFDKVFSDDPDLLLWKNQEFSIIGIGYKEEVIGYKIGEFSQQNEVNVNLNLENKDLSIFKRDLKQYTRRYNKENKILVDIEYQAFFYQEMKKKEKEKQEHLFIENLRSIVFPCCFKRMYQTFNFDRTKLNDVILELNKQFNESIILLDESKGDLLFTAHIENANMNEIVTIICASFEFEIKYDFESKLYFIK